MKPYFVLFVKWEADSPWSPEFGDHSRAVVKQELLDCYRNFDGVLTKIVRTDGTQEATESAQYKLNTPKSKS
jgi:hypothetical protein